MNAARDLAATGTQGEWRTFADHGRDYTDEGWSVIGIKVDQAEVALTHPIGALADGEECEADAEKAARAVNALPAIADLLDAIDSLPTFTMSEHHDPACNGTGCTCSTVSAFASLTAARDAVAAALTGETP